MVVDKSAPVADGDIVTVDYAEVDADGNEVAGTDRKDFIFTVGSGSNFYKIDSDILGMAKDETKVLAKTYAEDFEQAEYAGKTVSLRVTVKQVKRREVPLLDDDFAQDVSDQYKTVEDLRAATKAKLEQSLKGHLEEVRLNTLLDKILEQTTIAIPASMLEFEVDSTWRRFVSQSGMPEAQILKYLEFQGQSKADFTANWRTDADHKLRVQLIMDKIKDKEAFTVDQSEVEAAAEEQLKEVTDEDTRSYYKTMIEDDLKIKKTGEFLLANNSITNGAEIGYEEFMADHQH